MSKVEEIQKTFAELTPIEQRNIALWVNQHFRGSDVPGIEKTADVCGGSARIKDSRISVWMLESMRRSGSTDQDILKSYPHISASYLAAAWEYVERHADEISKEIELNEAE